MEPAINFFSVVVLLGAAQGVFLALALLSAPGGNHAANRVLASFTLVFVVELVHEFLLQSRYILEYPHILGVNFPNDFLYGPLIYLYVLALTKPEPFQFTRRQWWHFLPFAVSLLFFAPLYSLNSSQKIDFLYSDVEPADRHMAVADLADDLATLGSVLQMGIYFVLSFRQLVLHARRIPEQFSYTERINLSWLRNLLVVVYVVYLTYLFALFFADVFGLEPQAERTMYLLIVAAIYTMGYLGLRQPAIFSGPKRVITTEKTGQAMGREVQPLEIPAEPPDTRGKYKKSALSNEQSERILAKLLQFMESNQPYFDSTLTLPQLARDLGVSLNYLSQVINERLNKNFFDFVNEYRIEAAKQRLAQPTERSPNILTIALDVGFNSKSAFYTAFRKYTDMTPAQFRKIIRPT